MSESFQWTSRRQFLAGSLAAGAALVLPKGAVAQQESAAGSSDPPFQLPKLPYALDALAPFLSREQMEYHYGKHHAGYFKKLNVLVKGKPEAKKSLQELLLSSDEALSNNAGQAWNHTFFWNCLSPKGGGQPQGKLREAIDRDFGSFQAFQSVFTDAAAKLFGSGWGWLAADKSGVLHIMALSNAGNPLKFDKQPVLTIDVWEHAYYLDYRNERARFVEAFWNKANWDYAAQTYAKILKPA